LSEKKGEWKAPRSKRKVQGEVEVEEKDRGKIAEKTKEPNRNQKTKGDRKKDQLG